MIFYCFKIRKNTESKNPKVVKTKNGKIMLLSEFAVCSSESSKFIKEQQTKELKSNAIAEKYRFNFSFLTLINN